MWVLLRGILAGFPSLIIALLLVVRNKMASVSKLSIRGVRAFSPNDTEQVSKRERERKKERCCCATCVCYRTSEGLPAMWRTNAEL
jgi:hypothetical protein